MGYRFGVSESIPTVQNAHQIFVTSKTTLSSNFRGGAWFFSFDCRITLTLGENSNFKLLNWRKSQRKQILKIWRPYPLQFLQYYMFRSPHRIVHNWKVHWPCAFSMELQQRLQHVIKTSYTEQITRVKLFKLSEYVVFMIFFRLRTWNLDFDLSLGLHSHWKKNMMHPPKIDQKDRFSNK